MRTLFDIDVSHCGGRHRLREGRAQAGDDACSGEARIRVAERHPDDAGQEKGRAEEVDRTTADCLDNETGSPTGEQRGLPSELDDSEGRTFDREFQSRGPTASPSKL